MKALDQKLIITAAITGSRGLREPEILTHKARGG